MNYVRQNEKSCIDKTAAAIHNSSDADIEVQWQTSYEVMTSFTMQTMERTTETKREIEMEQKKRQKQGERESAKVRSIANAFMMSAFVIVFTKLYE